ncbi:MAG: tetraacyldisaccharide 4'-kinase [bacterium]
MFAIFIYRTLQWAAFPFILIYFLVRGLRDPRYRRGFTERLGCLPFRALPPGAIWLHAVSVGEVLAAVPLVRALRQALPTAPVFVSTTTLAGRAAAEDRLRGLAGGIFYAPIDYAWCVRRVFRRLRPRALVVMETEIWPNLWRESRRFGCALVIVNARISDRALPRYRRFAWFFRQALAWPDAVLAQSEQDRERYASLGATNAVASGNLKYDFAPSGAPPEAVVRLMEHVRPTLVWIAASTMPPAAPSDPDEDEAVVEAFRAATRPGLLLILVPRKPERFDSAAALLRREGIPFLRRSELSASAALELPGVLLLDSIGELSSLFGLADVVFMGGTLNHRGGHNILEPAAFGKPVIAGPHMENFADIAARFAAAGALVTVRDAAALGGAVSKLLDDAQLRAELGEKSRAVAASERGATARVAEAIVECYWNAIPRTAPALRALLWPLTLLWRAGSAVKRGIDTARRTRLATPVISVGGISAGGAGKTPIVLWLAERLAADPTLTTGPTPPVRQTLSVGRTPSSAPDPQVRPHTPAILMRGYRRRSRRPVILAPGERAPVADTGDEAQIYLRSGIAALGIAADRASAGRLLESRFHPSVFLIDDGFQHWRLHRDFDLVVLDGLDPFAGGAVLPLGRLRETPAALRRASAVVVTRINSAAAVERAIRRAGCSAPVFTARFLPDGWIDSATGRPSTPPERCCAFCGLGNPGSFWASLRMAGIEPVLLRAFTDHHKYTREELDSMSKGVDGLLTTEKDAANLPGDWRGRVFWLKLRVEIDREAELLALIRQRLAGMP